MRTDQAEIFLTVLEEESIAAAARRLGRSRTTLSTALSALEDELGASLFDRSGNELQPTGLAWSIQPDCLRFLQAYRRVAARCDQERQGVEVALRIARDDALPESFWRQTMRDLKDKFPLTGVSVYLAPPQELPALVENQAVDLALGLAGDRDNYEQLDYQELGQVSLLTVAASSHPLCRLSVVMPEDLRSETQVTLAYMDEQEELVPEILGSANYLALTQFELIRDAVLEGSGWAHLPRPLIADALAAGQLRVLRKADASQWQACYLLQINGSLQGKVASWLKQQLINYLATANLL
ncbi:DNA-binding transcriptional regulator, LysR family [Marinospirillum celere]|uniref:DNA-binding transcriptional regulator, LysR family n=1 Tax=Marinospirillum celere TaxID=1122252 RepID=A0A1I1DXY9_9GAMM|nr:LysR family transcriptional regulator [Marinospirillum celere]SFB77868.1 DNA-binding transcriptional regulator, LysR family [Marinospirillum celere]